MKIEVVEPFYIRINPRMRSRRLRTGRSLTVWRGGGVSLPGGFSLLGGSPCRGSPCQGGSPCRGALPAGGVLPAGDPPVNRMTDTCKNITLATTSLRLVTRKHSCRMRTIRCSDHRRVGGVLPGVCTSRRGVLPGGRGVYLPEGCASWGEGVCTCWGCTDLGGCNCLGVYLPRGCTCPGDVPAQGGSVYHSMHWDRHPPPCEQNHRRL